MLSKIARGVMGGEEDNQMGVGQDWNSTEKRPIQGKMKVKRRRVKTTPGSKRLDKAGHGIKDF